MTDDTYIGDELDLFQLATNWKTYWGKRVEPVVSGRVLEVGAGIGGTTRLLLDLCTVDTWTCLEPDPDLAARIPEMIAPCRQSESVQVKTERLDQCLSDYEGTVDTILYIDVIEHIEDDKAELQRAYRALKPGGRLVVLVPAHPFLFSEFDHAIGHYRRYQRSSLRACLPENMKVKSLSYLDCVGLAASTANRLFLRQSKPSKSQILMWDRRMVPISRWIDPLLLHRIGKSLLLVAEKEGGGTSESRLLLTGV